MQHDKYNSILYSLSYLKLFFKWRRTVSTSSTPSDCRLCVWDSGGLNSDLGGRCTYYLCVFSYKLTRYDNAVEYVGNEIASFGHSPRYDGWCGRSEHVLEEPHAFLVRRHIDSRKVLLTIKSATTTTIRQPISDQPVRYGTDDYNIL